VKYSVNVILIFSNKSLILSTVNLRGIGYEIIYIVHIHLVAIGSLQICTAFHGRHDRSLLARGVWGKSGSAGIAVVRGDCVHPSRVLLEEEVGFFERLWLMR